MAATYPFARHSDPPVLHQAALIVIDLQRAFTDANQPSFVFDAPAAAEQAGKLIVAFRQANRPVAFTRHAHVDTPTGHGMANWWSSFVIEGTEGSKLDPSLLPADGELVVRKHHYSAFRGTSLESWLHDQRIDTLVLAGTMTHICVDTTARDAFMLGLNVVVVTDACASKHRALHDGALQGLSHAVARLSSTEMLIAHLRELR